MIDTERERNLTVCKEEKSGHWGGWEDEAECLTNNRDFKNIYCGQGYKTQIKKCKRNAGKYILPNQLSTQNIEYACLPILL